MTVLVTGANGFVGTALCEFFTKSQVPVRAIVRTSGLSPTDTGVESVGDISSKTDWTHALKDVTKVVHLASRVHIMTDQSANPLAEYRLINVEGTVNLARQAAAAGVKRFVFLSSIKVNGEFTELSRPFTADDEPAPTDAYGISKHEAEMALRQIAMETDMEVVIIRPPLVYGPGVKANFAAKMRWLARGLPVPLAGMTHNRRSLVALDNLIDLIVTCLNHPKAANQTFLVSDAEDLSTADLLKRTGVALGKPARLFYVPSWLLQRLATLVNKPGIYQRLCGSLQVDMSKTRQLLAWTPPLSVDEGLRRAAKAFLR